MITSHALKKVSGRESLNQANCPLDTFNFLSPGLVRIKLSLTCLSSDIGKKIWIFTLDRKKNCVLPPADARSPVKSKMRKNKWIPLCCVVVVFFLFSFFYNSLVSLFLLFVLFAFCFSFVCLLFCLICYEHLLALLASKARPQQ